MRLNSDIDRTDADQTMSTAAIIGQDSRRHGAWQWAVVLAAWVPVVTNGYWMGEGLLAPAWQAVTNDFTLLGVLVLLGSLAWWLATMVVAGVIGYAAAQTVLGVGPSIHFWRGMFGAALVVVSVYLCSLAGNAIAPETYEPQAPPPNTPNLIIPDPFGRGMTA